MTTMAHTEVWLTPYASENAKPTACTMHYRRRHCRSPCAQAFPLASQLFVRVYCYYLSWTRMPFQFPLTGVSHILELIKGSTVVVTSHILDPEVQDITELIPLKDHFKLCDTLPNETSMHRGPRYMSNISVHEVIAVASLLHPAEVLPSKQELRSQSVEAVGSLLRVLGYGDDVLHRWVKQWIMNMGVRLNVSMCVHLTYTFFVDE